MSSYPEYKTQLASLDDRERSILNRIPHLENIDGWLLLIEAIELFDLSNSIESVRPIICEIGSWKGKSSYVLASAIKDKRGVVYSIDPFNGDGDVASKDTYHREIEKLGVTLLENFKNTIDTYGLRKIVSIIPLISRDARSNFKEQRIDLLFIDGNHEYESVKMDYDLWTPLIPTGGRIVLHDVKAVHVDGPRRVYEELILNNPIWKDQRIVGEMGIATKA